MSIAMAHVKPAHELERIRQAVAAGRWDEAAVVAEALSLKLETGRMVLTPEEFEEAVKAHEACEREATAARARLLSDASRLHGGIRATRAYAVVEADGSEG